MPKNHSYTRPFLLNTIFYCQLFELLPGARHLPVFVETYFFYVVGSEETLKYKSRINL